MPGYSLSQLTEVAHVMGVVREYNAPGSTFSRTYGLGLKSTPGQILPHRTGVYDIYNPTRTMPTARAPMSGPSRVARKPVGQKVITVSRFYESVEMAYEQIFRNRPLGSQYGTVDAMGQQYIARHLKHEIQKFVNLHEFMAVQMCRGGWSLMPHGEDLYPVLKGTAGAVIDVDTLVEAEQQGQLPVGPDGADIIDVSWDSPNAKIISQLMNLDKVHAARHGAPIRHVWVNGTTAQYLFDNVQLRGVAGTAYVLYQSMTNRPLDEGQQYPDTGYDIKFTAFPQVTFHVYNQVYIPGLVGQDNAAQTNASNIQYHIPDNEAIFTPDPDDWCEMVHGTEPVQFNRHEAVRLASGFEIGRTWEIEPPRVDLKFLFNGAPVITQPRSIYNPTVIFE